MTNIAKIGFYEKLHTIFERVAPNEMPLSLDGVADYLREGAVRYELATGGEFDLDEYMETLEGIREAFTLSMHRTRHSILLACDGDRKYEVNIYPIRDYLSGATAEAELDAIKSAMVLLVHESNIASFQKNYRFVEDLSMVLEDYYNPYGED